MIVGVQLRTHSDVIHFRLICCIVVSVESFLRNSKGGVNGWFKLVIERISGESLVDVVHSRNDCCEARG